MSRVGKKPIIIPDGVTAKMTDGFISIKGPKGELHRSIHKDIRVEVKDKEIILTPLQDTKKVSALWGLFRTLINNMVLGVISGFEKKLEFEGVGYRVAVDGEG